MQNILNNYQKVDDAYTVSSDQYIRDRVQSNKVALQTINQAYPNGNAIISMDISKTLDGIEERFNETTQRAMIQENLTDVNTYIDNSYNYENTRIKKVLNDSKNDVYILREKYMLKQYQISFTKFIINVILFTFFIVIVCAFIVCFTFYPGIGAEASNAAVVKAQEAVDKGTQKLSEAVSDAAKKAAKKAAEVATKALKKATEAATKNVIEPYLSWKVAGILLGIIGFIYALGLLIFYRQTLIRRKDDWTKKYFSSSLTNNSSCDG